LHRVLGFSNPSISHALFTLSREVGRHVRCLRVHLLVFEFRLRDFFFQLHHITSHHITSHHITSHHITSHHITSHHITSHYIAKSISVHKIIYSSNNNKRIFIILMCYNLLTINAVRGEGVGRFTGLWTDWGERGGYLPFFIPLASEVQSKILNRDFGISGTRFFASLTISPYNSRWWKGILC
jgi:hypothetical protein